MRKMERILQILQQRKPIKTKKGVLTAAGVAAGVTVGAVGTLVIAPALGFTSAGIAAGSIAASMMSSAAIANGGGVAAGSVVAVLQSAGAAGFSAVTTTAAASAGGVIGGGLGWLAGRRGSEKTGKESGQHQTVDETFAGEDYINEELSNDPPSKELKVQQKI